MSPAEKPAGIANLSQTIITTGLVLGIIVGIAALIFTVVLPALGRSRSFTIESSVPASAIDALPDNVELTREVPVIVRIEDPTAKQGLAVLLSAVIPYTLLIFVAGALRRILGTVRRGDPFITANVRRLRWIGFALIIGGPLDQYFSQFFRQVAAGSAGLESSYTTYSLPPTLCIVGIGVLALAHVFAQGVRLREDVEGTI